MRKVAIMQPYFFPYLGYWQMLNAVDKFVLYDDVNFITRGYVNRNSILINGKANLFSIPIKKSSQNRLIMDTKLNFDTKSREKFLKTIIMAYKKAPQFINFYPILEDIINNTTDDLSSYIKYAFKKTQEYIITQEWKASPQILLSSEIKKDNKLSGQDKIIEINKQLGSTQYINAIGGQALYDKAEFAKNGIELYFIKMNEVKYKQFDNEFVPNLSFIDVLMFNDKAKVRELLGKYKLI